MKFKRGLLFTCSVVIVQAAFVFIPALPPAAAQFRGDEQANIDVYQIASPAVVTINTGKNTGSGSLVSPDGLVLTNEHVVRGATRGVQVRTNSGKTYQGQILAIDDRNDLALLKLISTDRFPSLNLAKADGIRVGQKVFAIGSPYGLSGTLTTGILSRVAENGDLQTDAALHPGNSGGPLLNSRGEVIGVNKAILANRQGSTGIGFATSALIAKSFIDQNRSRPVITPAPSATVPVQPSRSPRAVATPPQLGVTVDPRTLIIQQVQRGSLAARVGLRSGDRLVAVNGRRLRQASDLQAFLNSYPSSAILTVGRNRQYAQVRINF